MAITREQLINTAAILATTSITGISIALGETLGLTILSGIGIGLAPIIIDRGAMHLKEKWLDSTHGILNHDIQHALVRAFIKALGSLEEKYFALDETDQISKEKKEAIKSLFQELKDEAQTIFIDSIEKAVSSQEIKSYLYDDPQKAKNELWERIDGTKLIYSYYGEHFKDFLRDNCLDEVVFYFGLELKDDNKESNKAWRAFQRMLLEGIQADVKAVKAGQDEIKHDLKILTKIKKQLDEIKDTIDHRLPTEPFQESFAKALTEIQNALQDVAKTTRRIDEKQDRHIKTTEGIASDVKKLLSESPEPQVPKVPKNIKAVIDKGWDSIDAGKYDDSKAFFQRALKASIKQKHSFAIAEVKYNQAAFLIDYEGSTSAARPLLEECLEEYKNANSDLDIARVLRQFGLIEITNGNFDLAKTYTSQALDIFEKGKKKTGIGDCLRQLGWIAHALGKYPQSVGFYDQALAISLELVQSGESQRRKGEEQAVAACYAHKAMVLEAMGNVTEAEATYMQGLEWQRKANMKSETAKLLLRIAELKSHEVDFEPAIEFLAEAATIYSEIKNYKWLARCFDLRSRICFTDGETAQAIAFLRYALELTEESDDFEQIERYLNKLGQLSLTIGDIEDSKQYFEKARDLSLREEMLDGYAAAVRQLAQIAEKQNDGEERNKLLVDGIQALEKLSVSTQREPERAGIMGRIASLYVQMEDFHEALNYFHKERRAWEAMSNIHGVAGALGGIAFAKQRLGKPNEAFDHYRELKTLVDGSPYYDLIAGAANNLANFEMSQGNLNEAKSLLDEAEFYSRKYKLPLLRGILGNKETLTFEFNKAKAPNLDLDGLITDLYAFIDLYPESRESLFRFWFYEKAGDLYSNYRNMPGVKLLICQDDVDLFLKTAKTFAFCTDLSLQSVGSKFPGTITEWFEYPADRHFPAFFTFGFLPKDFPKNVQPEIPFSEIETRYFAIPMEPNPRSKTTGNEGVLTFGWSRGLPEQAHQLILSRTAQELIEQKIFFLPFERHLANDELLSVLQVGKDNGLIPVYLDSLPTSENIKSLHSAKIVLPILSSDDVERQRKQIRKVKHALMQLLSVTKDSAQSALNNLVFEVEELSDAGPDNKSIQLQIYILEFSNALNKDVHVALVITNLPTASKAN